MKLPEVVRVLERIVAWRGYPVKIRIDNGPEFIGKALDRWAYENNVTSDFSRPGKTLKVCRPSLVVPEKVNRACI